MLGELQARLDQLNYELTEAQYDLDDFILDNEGSMPPFAYKKKLQEKKARIAELRSELIACEKEYRQVLKIS